MKKNGKDEDGVVEAQLRKKLLGIMSTYDLLEHFDTIHDKENYLKYRAMNDPENPPKSIFTDKKLNKLWLQAEHAGFKPDELNMLRTEFQHHQDKIDEYHAMFQEIDHHTSNLLPISK